MKIGLKLWSTNEHYIPAARGLFANKVFDYIELFIIPGSLATIPLWQDLSIPYILHAPHGYSGFNLASKVCRNTNFELIRQVHSFFYALTPDYVIFHPGFDGDLHESISQFQSFGERYPSMYQKVIIENKPQIGLKNEICMGASPEEMRSLLAGTGRGFCLDFGHAICYSVAVKKQWKDVLADFLMMEPIMYHLCDGFLSTRDAHEHLGNGEFDLPYLMGLVGQDKYVTLETNKGHPDSLNDFYLDVQRLREYAGV